jgi:hypothetical protein
MLWEALILSLSKDEGRARRRPTAGWGYAFSTARRRKGRVPTGTSVVPTGW